MNMAMKKKKEHDGGRRKIPKTVSPLLRKTEEALDYQVGNLQGVGARERQEDSFCIINAFDAEKRKKRGLFFAVCDGMGGMKDGKVASEIAVRSLRNAVEEMDMESDLSLCLREAAFRASEEVEAVLEGGGGSTVVAGIIYQDRLCFVSIGDSCFFLIRDGQLYRLNLEHNMCNEVYLTCIRGGIVDPTEGRADEESAALTGFLGMSALTLADGTIRPLPMKEGDILLACSDGVSGTLSELELRNALAENDLVKMCRNLEEGILGHAKPYQDNYTAVVVKCITEEV